MIASQTRIELL